MFRLISSLLLVVTAWLVAFQLKLLTFFKSFRILLHFASSKALARKKRVIGIAVVLKLKDLLIESMRKESLMNRPGILTVF
jgi:hypothetical protein